METVRTPVTRVPANYSDDPMQTVTGSASWSSSAPEVSVDAGLVVGPAPKTTTTTATYSGQSAQTAVEVSAGAPTLIGNELDREISSLANAQGDKPARLLIVDDEPQVASMLRRFLSHEGYDVSVLHDGESAIAWMNDHTPDVVVFDIKLPGVTGIDLCRRMKVDRATRLIPVVLITGHASPEEQLDAVDAGADDVVSKPVNSDQFRIRLRSLIRIKRYTDDLESAGAVMMTLATMIESRDGSAEGHCHRIANRPKGDGVESLRGGAREGGTHVA